MGKSFNHLVSCERDLIAVRKAEGKSNKEIAFEVGKHPSTISRELKRNKSKKEYLPSVAEEKAKQRWKKSHQKTRIPDLFTRNYIEDKIKNHQWTPELISGRLKLEHPEHYVSHETIYMYIYIEKPEWGLLLPRKRHRRVPKSLLRKATASRIPDRVSILERPKAIDKREEFGHFEADCIVSTRTGKGALLTLTERKTRYTIIAKLTEKTMFHVNLALSFALSGYDKEMLLTITYDNGLEFAGHNEINNVYDICSYFCEPYHSWEKGTIENRNGIIRRYFPKGTDFSKVTEEEIRIVQDRINNRPLKCLGYLTPKEVHDKIVKNYVNSCNIAFAS